MSQWLVRMSGTRLNHHVGLVLDTAMPVALLYHGLQGHPAPARGILIFSAGLALFTLIEYAFHRCLFHGPVAPFEQGHRRHHEDPLGYAALPFFLPPLVMLALAGALSVVLAASDAWLFAAALATGYALYGLSHAVIHARRFRSPFARRWAAFHHVHHHHPETNFGVTTPFWDVVFGTRHVQRRPGMR